MAGLLRRIRQMNGLEGHALAEPFAGGAGASLALLYGAGTSRILVNDADGHVHAF